MANKNPFASALATHDMPALRAAFEACQEGAETGYDRTTLNRWLDGSVPVREPFIQCLAERLKDPKIYTSWQEARGARSPSRVKTVVSRFEGLTAEEKDEAFHEIRRDYVAEYPSVRSRLNYRIEISDPDPDNDHLQVHLDWSWTGDIPANATVQYVTAYQDLSRAYRDPACVFREELPFEPDRLHELLAAGEDQILAITPLNSPNPRATRHVGQLDEDGTFTFDNDAATNATVQLSISYPYPRNRQVFLLRFGGYQVPDTAEVTLVLRATGASSPRAFPYMPPGRQGEWTWNRIRANELFVSLGTGNTVLSEGDGVVLYWTED